jgi:CheY-like chemotaxis protein
VSLLSLGPLLACLDILEIPIQTYNSTSQVGRPQCLIAVTGYGQEEDRQRALAAGFDVHLVKPVDPEKLLGYLA